MENVGIMVGEYYNYKVSAFFSSDVGSSRVLNQGFETSGSLTEQDFAQIIEQLNPSGQEINQHERNEAAIARLTNLSPRAFHPSLASIQELDDLSEKTHEDEIQTPVVLACDSTGVHASSGCKENAGVVSSPATMAANHILRVYSRKAKKRSFLEECKGCGIPSGKFEDSSNVSLDERFQYKESHGISSYLASRFSGQVASEHLIHLKEGKKEEVAVASSENEALELALNSFRGDEEDSDGHLIEPCDRLGYFQIIGGESATRNLRSKRRRKSNVACLSRNLRFCSNEDSFRKDHAITGKGSKNHYQICEALGEESKEACGRGAQNSSSVYSGKINHPFATIKGDSQKEAMGRNMGSIYMQTRSRLLVPNRAGSCFVTKPPVKDRENKQSRIKRMQRRRQSSKANDSLQSDKHKSVVVRSLLDKYLARRVQTFHGAASTVITEAYFPFLIHGAGRILECFWCKKRILSRAVFCAHKDCFKLYHYICARRCKGASYERSKFICPHHVCMYCERSDVESIWRCERCTVAAHMSCLNSCKLVVQFQDNRRTMICWRHTKDWKSVNEHNKPTSDIQEIFCRLPLPYIAEDFSINSNLQKEVSGGDSEPPYFIQIRRNTFLVKMKRDDSDDGVGCFCNGTCESGCECRTQSMSCSKHCRCKGSCHNKPFRREKRLKLVKTNSCGWGVESLEFIKKDSFIIEYVGEVINEAICEDRLWAMKDKAAKNFYMCEIGKDFIIDATFKGNVSRFLNHSCNPNCKLEKWVVDGKIRIGIFAMRDIQIGEPLTYDYRFVQFGSSVNCYCGASNCRGVIGEPSANVKSKNMKILWGLKQKRSSIIQNSTSST